MLCIFGRYSDVFVVIYMFIIYVIKPIESNDKSKCNRFFLLVLIFSIVLLEWTFSKYEIVVQTGMAGLIVVNMFWFMATYKPII